MARYAAKNVVAAKLAKKCEIELSYAIGFAEPISVFVDTFGTGIVSDEKIATVIDKVFDFHPSSIIKDLDLLKPIYLDTARYGHFGIKKYSWEKTDKVDALKKAVGKL